MPLRQFKSIILHHSTTPDGQILNSPAIFKYHTSYRVDFQIVDKDTFYTRRATGQGKYFQEPWRDVGYHFLVEKVKNKTFIIVGRPLTDSGAHCLGKNNTSIGVCFVGNYDKNIPDNEMVDVAATRIIAPLCKILDIPVENIKGHCVYSQKSCPGKKFPMTTFRNIVKTKLEV